ncbi:MAG: hypothetical protein AAF512_18850 [Pseudomonadota bacterium]
MILKTIHPVVFIGSLIISTACWAVSPPYIALANGEGYQFNRVSCIEAAVRVLRDQGFARIKKGHPTVFGAYRNGSNYGFKVSVRCMAAYKLVAVTVVTDRSGTGQRRANSILQGIGRYASKGHQVGTCPESVPLPEPPQTPSYVNCADANTMAQCLSTIPRRKIGTVIEYLQGIR